MNDLSLIETDTLINELSKRFDASIFMGIQHKVAGLNESKIDNYVHRWFGGHANCLGLVILLKQFISETFHKQIREGS